MDGNNGQWYIYSLAKAQTLAWDFNWGFAGATPVSIDYNGDGTSDLAVYDSNSGNWYIYSLAEQQALVWAENWGWYFAGAEPRPADYDADHRDNPAIYVPNRGGSWYIVYDSDKDWMPDWWEMRYFGNLNQAPDGDYDDDGLSNLLEYEYDLDPTDQESDTDGDGIPDTWELDHGFDPLNPDDALEDADKDGYLNIFEYHHESNPLVKTSIPPASYLVTAAPGSIGLQSAINAAKAYDVIVAAPGVYKGIGNKNLTFLGKKIALVSQAGARQTVIDCEGAGRGFYFSALEDRSAVLRGFTVRNGNPILLGGDNNNKGGAILCLNSSPTITDCIFTTNTAINGGAMYCGESSALMRNCMIQNNNGWGGGIYCSNANLTIQDCVIRRNGGGIGGGIYCENSSPAIGNSVIAENGDTNCLGGGIFCQGSRPVIRNCTIGTNSASIGGGLYCAAHSDPIVQDCGINGNTAGNGAGIRCESSAPTVQRSTISGNLCKGSIGGGIDFFNSSGGLVQDCRISGNGSTNALGGGISCNNSSPMIDNCALLNNVSAFGGGIYCANGSRPLIQNTCHRALQNQPLVGGSKPAILC